MLFVVFSLALLVPFLFLLFYSVHVNRKWSSLGVPHLPALPFLGNSAGVIFKRCTLGQNYEKVCNAFPNAPFVGYVDFLKPQLVIKDLTLIEQVLVKDFHHFTDHGLVINEKLNPFGVNLFVMEGNRWRALRNKLTPMFTTGKLRGMTSEMSNISKKMLDLIATKETEGVELLNTLSKFTMAVIGSCGFGIDPGTMSYENNKFMEMGLKVLRMSPLRIIRQAFLTAFPRISEKLGIPFNLPDVEDYFVNVLRDTFAHRRSTGVIRNDFVQMMLTLKDKGTIEVTSKDPADDYLKSDTQVKDHIEISDEVLLGQSLLFLTAGFDSVSAILAFACYELAMHPEIQEKARYEVLHAVPAQSPDLAYDDLKKMTFLDNCIKETMRMYPPGHSLFRICTKDYSVPGSSFVIKKNTEVIIPIHYLHLSPEFHTDPKEFRPERFDDTPKFTFLPFGDGPRICIAMRFALMKMRVALAQLLRSYRISVNEKTKIPITIKKGPTFISVPSSPIYFDLAQILKK